MAEVDPFEAEFGPKIYDTLHGSGPAVAPTSAPTTPAADPFEAEFLPKLKNAFSTKGYELKEGTVPSGWNAGYNTLDAALFGIPHSVAPIISPAGNIMGAYQRRLDVLNSVRNQWSQENPLTAMGTELAGGALGTTAAMAAGQEYLAAPMAARLAAAAPRLAPALDFLGGASGGFNKGFIPGAIRTGSLATRGAAEGSVAGAAQSLLGNQPASEQVEGGALAGAVLNPLLGRLAPATKIAPEIASAVQSAIRQGVPMRVGMVPGAAGPLTSMDQLFNMGNNPTVQQGFDKALTAHAGLPSENLNQKWVEAADAMNGGTMERIGKNYDLDSTNPSLGANLAHIDAQSQGNLSVDAYKKYTQLRSKIEADMVSGSVPGKVYQAWTGKGGLLENYAKDPELRQVIKGPGGLKDAIDGAWEDSIKNSGLPGSQRDYAAWQQARKQYKNTRIIDDALDEAKGLNPQSLQRGIEKRYGTMSNAGELGDLGIAGQFIYKGDKPPAQSNSILAKVGSHPSVATTGSAALGAGLGVGLESMAGDIVHHIATNPWEAGGLGAAAALGIGGIGKVSASILNSPAYTKHLLDIAQGTKKPLLRGISPTIPVGSDLMSHRQIGTEGAAP